MALRELDEAPKPTPKKAGATSKAILNQKYASKACYIIEEVNDESTNNACPGLAIPQQGQIKFRCRLELPEFTVVSDVFTRKKDAEQAAAKMALEKLGILLPNSTLTMKEQWEKLVSRLSFLFKDEAAKQSNFIYTSRDKLWISRQTSGGIQPLFEKNFIATENIQTEAIFIPCCMKKPVEAFHLEVAANEYYVDVIAQKLGVIDSSQVLISRAVGKSSSEIRLYFPVPNNPILDYDSCVEDLSTVKETTDLQSVLNVRASYFSGQTVYGDAILAALGYTWRSAGSLFHESISLASYYRMLLSRLPDGNYKISRDAPLAAELPLAFTARSNWRGSFPRDLLCTFCHQHHLSEPVFSVTSSEAPLKAMGEQEKLESENPLEVDKLRNRRLDGEENGESCGDGSTKSLYRCTLTVLTKRGDIIIECSPGDFYRSKNDAVQSAALKVLGWLSKCFKQFDFPVEKFVCLGSAHGIHVSVSNFSQQFSKQITLYGSLHNVQQKNASIKRRLSDAINGRNQPNSPHENGKIHFNIEGPDSGIYASNGSLACISYAVFWVNGDQRNCVDRNEQFEFEMGVGAVIFPVEDCVSQMSVNQVGNFITSVPSEELIQALNNKITAFPSSFPYDGCLEYSIKLLQITAPMEDRMEQAFFNPPLSKQRLEFALTYIRESRASTLVDFGCGSGSLLDALFQHDTTLEEIAGVDISQKSLSRAAKTLYSNLSRKSGLQLQHTNFKTVVLYEGSIIEFDHRLYGVDIGTCLEVIEHMEEEQACVFGNLVLSTFCPHILIVSTPNHEYNSILHRSSTEMNISTDEALEEIAQAQPYRFRNHDHKFEWTRLQFNQWAVDLASRHNYSVKISGVGGAADTEPGFASQIAVFQRKATKEAPKECSQEDMSLPYKVRWKWGVN
ncbi:small RNA 2'-O-methyltransferase isoform X2 [Nymphaea colorata]|uniref:small RNA 2'-O-methyltransferase isoform X2 n=1 Tax=Nymphaea colorata TaxID=210225 RepID=UPI00129E9954|nr:small RNA 2'-O-methyltransferase isoform X2 [Nymphaea colorata]